MATVKEELRKVTFDMYRRRFNTATGSIAWPAFLDLWLQSDGLAHYARFHLSHDGVVKLSEGAGRSGSLELGDQCGLFLRTSLNGFLEQFCGTTLMVRSEVRHQLWVSMDGTEINFPGLVLAPRVSA